LISTTAGNLNIFLKNIILKIQSSSNPIELFSTKLIYMLSFVMRLVTALNTSAASDPRVERDEIASILMKVGLKRNVAKVLTYLAGVAEATSREIELGSDLRQPEVSIAMREIRKLDWIAERDEKNPGKGRPYRIYKLNRNLHEIIDYLDGEQAKESERIMKQIEKLKSLKSS
jgi:predicted transcriptional regulator